MSGFWSSLFGGSSSNLNNDISQTGALSSYASGLGQKNTTAGSNFFQSLLSGDPTKTSQVLAPEISNLKTSVQSDQKKGAQEGNRSGGTAAANAYEKDKAHSDITAATAKLTGEAANTLLSSGQSLLGTALGGYQENAALDHQRMENWANSILGRSITGGISAAETMGLGAAGGALAGTGAGTGANSALLAGLGG
ncbi:unnamed protein product [Sphagnum balticum]